MNASIRFVAALLLVCPMAWGQFEMDDRADPKPELQAPFDHQDAAAGLLGEIRAAHQSAGLIKMSGTLSAEWIVMGQTTRHRAAFTTEVAPGRLQHTLDAAPALIADGAHTYIHFVDAKQYAEYPGIKPDADAAALPAPIVTMLLEQNPAALLVLASDADEALLGAKPAVRTVEPVEIDGKPLSAMELWRDNVVYTLIYDPSTKLLRQVRGDLSSKLTSEGVASVEKAALLVDYAEVTTGPVPADPIGWTPPRDARLIGRDNPVELIRADADNLQGRPAPTFTLKSLAGDEIALADLKGQVVVLDFWATWCPPCREGLPHIAKLHSAHKDAGLRVYAINVREAPAKIKGFLDQQKLDLPVLLDADGNVAQQFGVTGIPTTVVIGRDGKVQKVFVGFSADIAKSLDAAVEAALAP